MKHFFNQKPDVKEVKFAALGKATAETLKEIGKHVDFVGSSNDTEQIGKEFAKIVGDSSVLFPQSQTSMRTVQQQLSAKENIFDLVVYHAAHKNDEQLPIADCSLLIFTSPSNVEAYFSKYKIEKMQKVIAMGNATASALKTHNVNVDKQPASFDDLGLLQAVFGL